jgi:hypothetical protein
MRHTLAMTPDAGNFTLTLQVNFWMDFLHKPAFSSRIAGAAGNQPPGVMLFLSAGVSTLCSDQ